ncbi:MAG: hypothetical protein NT069_10025, partial [Planctomycetota bacterium]|nr:hypothetical protein [Planctomycetota bacterium]
MEAWKQSPKSTYASRGSGQHHILWNSNDRGTALRRLSRQTTHDGRNPMSSIEETIITTEVVIIYRQRKSAD